MKRKSDGFEANKDLKLHLNKKELELVKQSSPSHVKFFDIGQIKQYIRLVRKLRGKYRDLNQRQKVAKKDSEILRTEAKAGVFDRALSRYQNQLNNLLIKDVGVKIQAELDHDQHYDIDGVTRVDGKTTIPSYIEA